MKKIFSYMSFKQKLMTCLFVVLNIVTAVLGVVEPKLMANIVDALTESKFSEMLVTSAEVAGVAISAAVIGFLARNLAIRIKSKVCKVMKLDICDKALKIKSPYYQNLKSGELARIATEDSETLMNNINDLTDRILSSVSAIAVMIYVFYISWQSGILFIVFFAIIILSQNGSLKKEEKHEHEKNQNQDSAVSLINQIFLAFEDIKILGMRVPIFGKYSDILNNEVEADKQKKLTISKNRMMVRIILEVYTVAFLVFGTYLMMNDWMTVKSFITIFLYRSSTSALVFSVVEIRSLLKNNKQIFERIKKITEIDSQNVESFGKVEGRNIGKHHKISIKNLSFRYSGKEQILKNISYEFSTGFYGIMGKSGSGKTTLLKLIGRQLETDAESSIKIDGVSINEFSENSFLSMVSMASQNPYIFSFTIRENLKMVKSNATEAQMWDALEKANLSGLVKSLEYGLDTQISEKMNLSGGEKQRLSLARIFLKDAPIILLDEATSALDNEMQADVTKVIQKMAKEKIVIAVAHRIEAVQDADEILFMENGEIAQVGNYQTLLKNKNFAELVAKKERV